MFSAIGQVFAVALGFAVIPGHPAGANPESTGEVAANPTLRVHPVVGSGFSLREPRNDRRGFTPAW